MLLANFKYTTNIQTNLNMQNKDAEFPVPDFRKLAENVLKDLPKNTSEKARAFFLGSFIKQGFTDTSFIPWVKRKDDLSHKLLQQSLALKNSINITQADFKAVEITAGEGINYGAIHNEGGTIKVKVTPKMKKFFWAMYKKTEVEKWKFLALTKKEEFVIKIPKRQFIGNSETLMTSLDNMFINEIYNYFKNLK